MSFYCFETRQDRTLAPYPPPEFSQQIEKMSPAEIVDHIITTNIDQLTLSKIEKAIAVPLRQLISPRENRRRRCIPRPQNNFVLYRRNFHAVITKERGNGVAKNFKLISNEAAKNWSEESNEIKQLYELIADCAKKVHDCTYPQYVYQPKHKSNKKGGNGTIFREVTVDPCSKKNGDKNKDVKDLKALEEARKDKITMTKSFVAATTFLSNIDVSQHSAKASPAFAPTPVANLNHKGYTSKFSITNPEDSTKRQWRWAHYYNQSNQNNQNLQNHQNIQNIQNNQNNQSNPSNQINQNDQIESTINPINDTGTATNSCSSVGLLPTIDIPISSNFLATYDRNVWSLVNGYTNV